MHCLGKPGVRIRPHYPDPSRPHYQLQLWKNNVFNNYKKEKKKEKKKTWFEYLQESPLPQ